MKTKIIKIGNSQGILLPKSFIKGSELGQELELVVEKNQLIISPIKKAREGWDELFQKMNAAGDDKLLD